MPPISERLQQLEAIYKAAATDFKISGVLTDQQTEAWFTNIFEKNAFLQAITRRLRSMLTGNTGFIEGNNQAFARPTEGTEPAELNTHTQRFSQYLLLDLMLPAFVGYSVIDDNPQHGLLDKINQVLDQNAANSLQNLAINGTLDDNSAGFFTLMKGWIQLAKDSVTINKVLLVVDDIRLDDLDSLVLEMLLELPQEYRSQAVIVMSDDERIRRNDRITRLSNSDAQAVAIAAMTEEQRNIIGTKRVVTPDFWPDQVFMLTVQANLEIDVHKTVRRTIEEKPRRQGFEYTYLTKADCEIIDHRGAVISYI